MSRRLPPPLLFTLLCLSCGPGHHADAAATAGTTSAATSIATTTDADASTTTATATSSASATAASTSTSTTGCSFLDCQDPTGSPCGSGVSLLGIECDVWVQDCPEGQKCTPWENTRCGWYSTRCVDIAPNPGKPGDPCTVEGDIASGVDTCEKAALCWDVDPDTLTGTCVAMCMGSQEKAQCPDGTSCVISESGVLILCLPNCDPLAQDCDAGSLCLEQSPGAGFTCVLDASGDKGALNDPCAYLNACDAGLACAPPALAAECDPNQAGCCLPFCDLTNPKCTNRGAVCLPWYEMGTAPPGYEDVGICGLMP